MMRFDVSNFDEALSKVSIGSGTIKLNVFGKSMHNTSDKGFVVYGSIEAFNPVQNIQVTQHFFITKSEEELTEDVSVFLDYKNLFNAVKALSKISDTILVSLEEKEVTLSVGKTASLSLSMVEPTELVQLQSDETPILKATVKTEVFLEGIKNGAYCCSASMPSAKGVFIKVGEKQFDITTLDSTSMARAVVPAEITCEDSSVTSVYVSASINQVKNLLESDTTSIALVKNYLLIQNGFTFILIGLLTEQFPEQICGLFNNINQAQVKFTLDKKELLTALDVVTFDEGGKGKITFEKKGKTSLVIFSAANEKNNIKLSSKTDDFEKFSLSAAVLRETLDHVTEDSIVMSYISPKKPIYIKGLKDGKEVEETHIVTPIATNQA